MISKLEKATVFLQGAELCRSMVVEAALGKGTAVFGGLPANITPESVSAGVSQGALLLGVTSRVEYTQSPEADQTVRALQEQLDACEDKIAQNRDAQRVLNEEEVFLGENRQIGGEKGIKLEDLREIAQYYRTRLGEIAQARFALQKELEALEEEQSRLEDKMGATQGMGTRASGEIVVEYAAQEPGQVELTVSYFVPCAGWSPSYEIRVEEMDGPALLVGKAEVVQTTGEDWQDLEVTLSSGSPSLGGRQPQLTPWYLDWDRPATRSQFQSFHMPMAAAPAQEMTEMTMEVEELAPEPMRDERMLKHAPRKKGPEARQSQTSVEFVLPGTISVPSVGKGQQVEIMRHRLPATYQHYSVRKLEKDVFLLAKIAGWEALSLLAGEVGIFLGNTYVGNTALDPRRADDVLELSLGRDPGVIVTRVKGRDFTGRTLLGKNTKASREWLLTVRNTRQTPIDIKVLDQVPVSVNKAITVEAVEISGAAHDPETGELCWELHLEPGQAVEKTVRYVVTYPAKGSLSLE